MKLSKYKNRKITVGGEEFDSQREYERWQQLRLLERAGKISTLFRQVSFELIPAQYETVERISEKTGKRLKDQMRCVEQKCCYVADFVYWKDGQMVVEDAKGVRTDAYIIKRKLMLKEHGIRIREV